MAPKKSGAGGATLQAKEELKAILLADSFAQDFWPITVEVPRVLLPLANVPLIDWSLEWLATNGVEEVFVVCCVHAEQIQQHIEASKWKNYKAMKVTLVKSVASQSMGDALRAMDQKGCIDSDFVLITGDTVTNFDLSIPLKLHKQRREKDKNAILTLITKQISGKESWRRLGYKQVLIAVDPKTDQLLRYKELEPTDRHVNLDAHFFGERSSIRLHTDLFDSQIQICAPEVLMLFTDNFDYQDLRQNFIPGTLSEEELGNKLYVYMLKQEYGFRVRNLRTYDAVSRDVIQRWAFPFALDTNVLPLPGESTYTLGRKHVYREQGVVVARDAVVEYDSALGSGTHIDEGAQIRSSVIGRGCRIGKNVIIENSYLHDGVTVWQEAQIKDSMLCKGVTVMPEASVSEGSIISFNVVIGKGHKVNGHKRISLCRQQAVLASDSEDDREVPHSTKASSFGSYSDDDQSGVKPSNNVISYANAAAAGNSVPSKAGFEEQTVGRGGAGMLWDMHFSETELARTSLLRPLWQEDIEDDASDSQSVISVDETPKATRADIPDSNEPVSELSFKQEVTETVLKCIREGQTDGIQNAIVELNSLKLAENKSFADIARFVFGSIMSLTFPAPIGTNAEYKALFPQALASTTGEMQQRLQQNFDKWGPLLQQYLKGSEEQVDLLLTLEEFCDEEPPFGVAGQGSRIVPLFPWILKLWYDKEYIDEESVMSWATEKTGGTKEEQKYVRLSAQFITWLQAADEESEGSDEDDDDDEDESEEESE